jgi:hypothetical protein
MAGGQGIAVEHTQPLLLLEDGESTPGLGKDEDLLNVQFVDVTKLPNAIVSNNSGALTSMQSLGNLLITTRTFQAVRYCA